ncbi:hypothetical protein [Microbacterium sp.]|uniref:hypothetical protein n=1 Tax=Microbacterium sp. TaxID=51671 RepID=UPI0039E30345
MSRTDAVTAPAVEPMAGARSVYCPAVRLVLSFCVARLVSPPLRLAPRKAPHAASARS